MKLILASQSRARKVMLEQAGLVFEAVPAGINERAITEARQKEGAAAEEIAALLACGKTLAVAARHKEALVIGSDQILLHERRLVDKADSPIEALEKLKMLQGKTHKLISAVCVAQGPRVLWEHADSADLTMRDLDDAQLVAYAKAAGPVLTECVGAYALEGAGAWLFEKIEGDYFTVLGMPLLPLLGFLRTKGFGP